MDVWDHPATEVITSPSLLATRWGKEFPHPEDDETFGAYLRSVKSWGFYSALRAQYRRKTELISAKAEYDARVTWNPRDCALASLRLGSQLRFFAPRQVTMGLFSPMGRMFNIATVDAEGSHGYGFTSCEHLHQMLNRGDVVGLDMTGLDPRLVPEGDQLRWVNAFKAIEEWVETGFPFRVAVTADGFGATIEETALSGSLTRANSLLEAIETALA